MSGDAREANVIKTKDGPGPPRINNGRGQGRLSSFKQEGANFKKMTAGRDQRTERAPRRVQSTLFAVETGRPFSKNNKQETKGLLGLVGLHSGIPKHYLSYK